jgi:hypothetical protein
MNVVLRSSELKDKTTKKHTQSRQHIQLSYWFLPGYSSILKMQGLLFLHDAALFILLFGSEDGGNIFL